MSFSVLLSSLSLKLNAEVEGEAIFLLSPPVLIECLLWKSLEMLWDYESWCKTFQSSRIWFNDTNTNQRAVVIGHPILLRWMSHLEFERNSDLLHQDFSHISTFRVCVCVYMCACWNLLKVCKATFNTLHCCPLPLRWPSSRSTCRSSPRKSSLSMRF